MARVKKSLLELLLPPPLAQLPLPLVLLLAAAAILCDTLWSALLASFALDCLRSRGDDPIAFLGPGVGAELSLVTEVIAAWSCVHLFQCCNVALAQPQVR